MGTTSITKFSSTEYVVRVKKETADVQGKAEKIRDALVAVSEMRLTIMSTDSLSGDMGERLRTNSTYAVIISLILMLVLASILVFLRMQPAQ